MSVAVSVLAPVALVLAAQVSPPPFVDPLPKVEAALRRAGYVLDLKRHVYPEGTIARGGRRVQVRLAPGSTYSDAMSLPREAALVELGAEFTLDRELPQTPLRTHGGWGTVVFRPSLGRTARAFASVVFDGKTTEAKALRQIDRYFDFVDAHASQRALPGSRDWRRKPLSDDLRLNEPDATSIRRLLVGWGFASEAITQEDLWGSRLDHDANANRVRGARGVMLSVGPSNDGEERPHWIGLRSHFALPKGVVAKAWVREHAAKAGGLTLATYGSGYADATQEVSLAKPMRAGELKRRIVAFARSVKALER